MKNETKKSQEVAKIKLNNEQKHYVEVLQLVEDDIKKKTAALERAEARIAKARKEVIELKGSLNSLEQIKKGAEAVLSSTPAPLQWENVFKTVYVHHYHYHYPNTPVYYPPYITPWWSTITSSGTVNLNTVTTLVTNTTPTVNGTFTLEMLPTLVTNSSVNPSVSFSTGTTVYSNGPK